MQDVGDTLTPGGHSTFSQHVSAVRREQHPHSRSRMADGDTQQSTRSTHQHVTQASLGRQAGQGDYQQATPEKCT